MEVESHPRQSGFGSSVRLWRCIVLRWSLGFFIVAIIAAVFGFGGIASGAAEIARLCFFFFIVIFVVSLIWGLATGRRSTPPL
jgi:uncharacterized membrane protein YtjA (UPF0391 family)